MKPLIDKTLLLAVTLLATIGAAPETLAASAFSAVCNAANNTGPLSQGDIKKLFTGAMKQWASGAPVQVGIIPGDAPETAYLASLVDMTSRELLQQIQEQVFKGEMRRPVVLRSSGDCAAFARSNPGAICFAASAMALPREARWVTIQ